MRKLCAAVLAAFGMLALAASAWACPDTASTGTGQQTVMTGSGTTQTPMPGKPGS